LFIDIIALLILGVLLMAAFIYWQAYLERIQDAAAALATSSPETSQGKEDSEKEEEKLANERQLLPPNGPVQRYTPWLMAPPLMKLSLWRRGNGRLAVAMWIAFLTWCSFLAWTFWVQVGEHLLSSPLFYGLIIFFYSVQLYYQNYLGLSPLHTVIRLLPMFVSGIICNMIVAAIIAYVPILYIIGNYTFLPGILTLWNTL
jgi:hypothetical protein